MCLLFNREAPAVTTSVRIKMKEAGLYEKFADDAKLLHDFKRYLRVTLKVPNCQQEVGTLTMSNSAHQFQQHSSCLYSFHDVRMTLLILS